MTQDQIKDKMLTLMSNGDIPKGRQSAVAYTTAIELMLPEIEALNQHLKMTQTGLDAWYNEAMTLTDENAKLKAEITRLRNELQKQTR